MKIRLCTASASRISLHEESEKSIKNQTILARKKRQPACFQHCAKLKKDAQQKSTRFKKKKKIKIHSQASNTEATQSHERKPKTKESKK